MKIFSGWVVVIVILIGGFFVFNSFYSQEEYKEVEAQQISIEISEAPKFVEVGEEATFIFKIIDADGNPASNLMTHHARKVHVLFVSKALNIIGHVHPEDFNFTEEMEERGEYPVSFTFPKAGEYMAGVDILTKTGPVSKQFVIYVEGDEVFGPFAEDLESKKCFTSYQEEGKDRYIDPVFIRDAQVECPKGYEVTLITSPLKVRAGEEAILGFHIEKGGEPVQDLEPYLDAPLHLAIVPESFDTLLHRHGVVNVHMEEGDSMDDMSSMEGSHMGMNDADSMMHHGANVPNSFGPNIESEPIVFPGPGLYQVFAQTKHNGAIIFMSFMIDVQE